LANHARSFATCQEIFNRIETISAGSKQVGEKLQRKGSLSDWTSARDFKNNGVATAQLKLRPFKTAFEMVFQPAVQASGVPP
jgi:hypothetical protein